MNKSNRGDYGNLPNTIPKDPQKKKAPTSQPKLPSSTKVRKPKSY